MTIAIPQMAKKFSGRFSAGTNKAWHSCCLNRMDLHVQQFIHCGADWWLFLLIHSLQWQGQPAHFCLNGWRANSETPKMVELYFQSQIWWQILNRKPGFQFEFSSNHVSISLWDICLSQAETDNVDHYYSWPPHCGRHPKRLNHLDQSVLLDKNTSLIIYYCLIRILAKFICHNRKVCTQLRHNFHQF